MRRLLLVALFGLGACDPAPTETLRLVTLDRPPGVGLSLRELPAPVLAALELPYALAVVQTGSLSESAGLRVGDVVYGVNQSRLRNAEDFSRLLSEGAGATLSLLVRRGRKDFYVMVEPEPGRPGMPARDTLLRT